MSHCRNIKLIQHHYFPHLSYRYSLQPKMADNNTANSEAPDNVKMKEENPSPPPTKKRIRLSLTGTIKAVAIPAVAAAAAAATTSSQQENGTKHNIKPESVSQATKIKTEDNTTSVASASTNHNNGNNDRASSPPKKKIKLVQVKEEPQDIPTTNSTKPAVMPSCASTEAAKSTTESKNNTVEATVLKNGEAGKDDAVAMVVKDPPSKPKVVKAKVVSAQKRKVTINPAKATSIKAMSSPGLLIPPGNNYHGEVNSKGLVCPNAIFQQAMAAAGYTYDSRSNNPHRGSSVQRTVDDMYDSDVKFSLNFPVLIPKEFLRVPKEKQLATAT